MIQHADRHGPSVRSLREIRLQKGVSLRFVAKEVGLDPTHLSRIERGEAQPTVDVLYRLAVVLDQDDLAQQLQPYLSPKAGEHG